MSLEDMFDACEDRVDLKNTVYFSWSAKGLGFGEFYFYVGDDGKIHCENELMSKQFLKDMLCKMVDECILDCPSQKDTSS